MQAQEEEDKWIKDNPRPENHWSGSEYFITGGSLICFTFLRCLFIFLLLKVTSFQQLLHVAIISPSSYSYFHVFAEHSEQSLIAIGLYN